MTHPQGLDYNCRIVWGPWLVTLQKPVTLLDALRKVQQWTMCMYTAFRNQSKKPKTNNNNNNKKKPHKLTDDKSISCLKHVAVFSSWKKNMDKATWRDSFLSKNVKTMLTLFQETEPQLLRLETSWKTCLHYVLIFSHVLCLLRSAEPTEN